MEIITPVYLLLSAALCLVYSYACLCLGAMLLSTLISHSSVKYRISPLSWIAASFLLGSGILANVWCLLLSMEIFYQIVISGIILVCIIGGSPFVWKLRKSLGEQFVSVWKDFENESIIWKVFTLAILFLMVKYFLYGFLPLRTGHDAAAFYMVVGKLFSSTKKLTLLSGYESFMSIGLHGEFHYAALMTLGSARAAKLFVWPISLAGVLLLTALARRAGAGRRGQWFVLGMIFSSSAYVLLTYDGKVDLFGAVMAIAAVFWVMYLYTNRDFGVLVLTGIFTGFAVVAKISYLPLLIPSIIILIIIRHFIYNEDQQKLLIRSFISLTVKLLIMGFFISLPIIIHFLKNWILLGEPFAPFYYFSGQGLVTGNWTEQSWFAPDITRRIILSYPLALIYGHYPMQYGTMSLMMLAFLPLVIFMPKTDDIIKSVSAQLFFMGFVGIVLWLILRPAVFAPRYNLYAFLLLIPLPAIWAEYVTKNEAKPAWLTRVIAVSSIAVICLAIITLQYLGPRGTARYLLGRIPEPLISGNAHYASINLNKETEPGDRVLSLTYFTYWYRDDLLQCMSTSMEQSRIISSPTPQQAWALVYKLGFKYIIYNQSTHSSIMEKIDLKQIPEWLLVEEIYNKEDYRIYRLTSKDNQHKSLVNTREIRSSVWQVHNIEDK